MLIPAPGTTESIHVKSISKVFTPAIPAATDAGERLCSSDLHHETTVLSSSMELLQVGPARAPPFQRS